MVRADMIVLAEPVVDDLCVPKTLPAVFASLLGAGFSLLA
jgi:hypothetical protein